MSISNVPRSRTASAARRERLGRAGAMRDATEVGAKQHSCRPYNTFAKNKNGVAPCCPIEAICILKRSIEERGRSEQGRARKSRRRNRAPLLGHRFPRHWFCLRCTVQYRSVLDSERFPRLHGSGGVPAWFSGTVFGHDFRAVPVGLRLQRRSGTVQ